MKVSQFTEQQRSSLAGSVPKRLATTASMPPTRRLFRNSCQQQRPRYQHCRRTLSPLCIASTENRKTTLICVRVVLGGVAMRRRIRKLKYENFCWGAYGHLHEILHLRKYPAIRYQTSDELHHFRIPVDHSYHCCIVALTEYDLSRPLFPPYCCTYHYGYKLLICDVGGLHVC